jgi:type IV pilus assembly protein PilQ
MSKQTLIVLLAVLFMVTPVFAQQAEQAPAVPAATNGAEEQAVSAEGNVNLDFRDADIKNVLRILSYKSGINIVAGPEVTGLVTIKLKDVPWQQALAVILETYNYGYEQKGNIITVTTIENLKKRREDAQVLADQEPLVTKTFVLNYAKASTIIESIEKMKTDRGSINYDERTNALIVRDISANVDLIGEVIDKLDQTTPQVLIESKIVETTLSNTENLGIDWITQATATAAARPHTWPFTTHSGDKYLKGDDFPDAQDDLFTFGTLDFSQLQAVLELLRVRTDTNILSNPRIVTLDNQPARIAVGSQYPIPQYTYNEEQARLQVNGWEYKDIGVIFEVTPHVNNAGFVTLDLYPKVTAILDYVTVENTSLPQLSNEEAKTTVMIKDGETLVIAGLIKDQVTETKKKTPIFGDIPLLGWIFTKKESSVTKTDLLIFLTPHIITPDTAQPENKPSGN